MITFKSRYFNKFVAIINRKKKKVFCIGFNKTGTTSTEKALKNLGFKMGNVSAGEFLLKNWIERDYRSIINFCTTAQAFQDVPFSLPLTYQFLDKAYPNSKFILTTRATADQWYSSLVRFHSNLFGNGNVPSKDDLLNAQYRYNGFIYDYMHFVFDTPDNNLYNRPVLIEKYLLHNQSVQEYFKNRPHDLLVLNISKTNAYKDLCSFLKLPIPDEVFPWENRSSE